MRWVAALSLISLSFPVYAVIGINDDIAPNGIFSSDLVPTVRGSGSSMEPGALEGDAGDAVPAPTVSVDINDVTRNEADGTLSFTITKTGLSSITSSVDFATAPDTATAPADYVTSSGTVTFAAGETVKLITITLTDDTVYESTERFFVNLSNPVNAVLSVTQGNGYITDDDSNPAIPPPPATRRIFHVQFQSAFQSAFNGSFRATYE